MSYLCRAQTIVSNQQFMFTGEIDCSLRERGRTESDTNRSKWKWSPSVRSKSICPLYNLSGIDWSWLVEYDEFLIILLDAFEADSRSSDCLMCPVSFFLISDVYTTEYGHGISCRSVRKDRWREKNPLKEYKAQYNYTSGSSQFIWLVSPVRQ